MLVEDKKIRDFVKKHPTQNYKAAGIDRVEIERTRDEVKVTLFVARPGLIIGKKGQEVERLQNEMQNLIGRRINLKVEEIGRPDLQAQLVAEKIGEQLQRRASFRRTMKRAAEESMDACAKGIKVQLAGRLGGAEMARREKHISGSIPLSTIRAKISYGFTEALTLKGISEFKFGLTKVITETKSMAQMPKRVKHRTVSYTHLTLPTNREV